MKKNRFLKVASAMIILCLITTCAVSTTFAKYTTAGSATDAARVAHWGITMDAGVSAFSDSYTTSVQSSNGDPVVAPGTDGYREYEVNGTPEVAYVITFAYDNANLKEVFLKAGTYNYNDAEGRIEYVDAEVTETKNGNYYPIKYTVTLGAPNATYGGTDGIANDTPVVFDTLAEALTAIANTTLTYDVNEDADCTLRISWAWAFDKTASSHIQDAGDTVLGDLIAGNTDLVFPATTDYNLTIAYEITMTATQLD